MLRNRFTTVRLLWRNMRMDTQPLRSAQCDAITKEAFMEVPMGVDFPVEAATSMKSRVLHNNRGTFMINVGFRTAKVLATYKWSFVRLC